MTERFLFRGKCTLQSDSGTYQAGDWVTGFIGFVGNRLKGEAFISVTPDFVDSVNVGPDTVGQCTGLRDKNNTLIFEGDIIKFRSPKGGYAIGLMEWNEAMLVCRYSQIDMQFFSFKTAKRYAEVVGNIYDNPEILRGSDEHLVGFSVQGEEGERND